MKEITDVELKQLKERLCAVLVDPLEEREVSFDATVSQMDTGREAQARIIRAAYEELAELGEQYGVLCCCSNCTQTREEYFAFAEYDASATVH